MTSYVPPTASDFLARLADAPCCAAIVDRGRLEAALASRAGALPRKVDFREVQKELRRQGASQRV